MHLSTVKYFIFLTWKALASREECAESLIEIKRKREEREEKGAQIVIVRFQCCYAVHTFRHCVSLIASGLTLIDFRLILKVPFALQYKMGEYKWKTYQEVDRLASSFGRGLAELGMRPRKNIVIFAETRAEWMIAAHACFKQNFTVVTIYSTLGNEAIAHGINETEVDTVITSHELLPKFKLLLDMVPAVKKIIYMEDQLKPTDTKGYKVRFKCHLS